MSDQRVDALRSAAQVVEEAGLPSDLRAEGFRAAILLGPEPAVRPDPESGRPVGATFVQTTDALSALADRLKLERSDVESVYYLDEDGRPALGLAPSRLGRRTAEGTRTVALLVALARQFDGHEQFTPTSVIRTVCQEFGVFDQGNFAKTLLAMGDVFQFQGKGVSRRVRLARPGYEVAAGIVRELA